MDRPKSHADDSSGGSCVCGSFPGEFHSCSPDDLNPQNLPKAKHLVSQRLEFSGKPILTSNKSSRFADAVKPRTRWLSGHYKSTDVPMPFSPIEMAPDFARSCPDRDPMACFGLMDELIGAVNLLSARQNQWCSVGESKSTIQVRKAAQSSTLLFVRKSVDAPEELVGTRKDLRDFDEENACSVFFKHSTCYDVLPESGKLLVFDSSLPIRRAMQGLIDHSLSAAPVWSNRAQTYTHLLTTDLCLRLLAQAFPLPENASPKTTTIPPTNGDGRNGSAVTGEPDSVAIRNHDPASSMGYWEGKTLGSVLKTYFSWARAESPEVIFESPVVVTPQDHLHRVTRLLTLATPVLPRNPSSPSANTETPTTPGEVFFTPQNTPPSGESDANQPPLTRQTVAPSRHILIADRLGAGNLLGIVNTDRLLSYLRLRMINLPTPSILNATVGDLQGIRWEERGWQIDDSLAPSSPSSPPAASRRRTCSRGAGFYLQPSTTCLEALHIMNEAWSTAGLACLPVAMDNGRGFQGMLTKLDILSTIFAGPLDVALSASIGTIMSVRTRPPGCTNQAMCFTTDPLVAVVDRIFRQKSPCLAVFERPGSGASWNGQGSLGPALGVITSGDLLHAIVVLASDGDAEMTASSIRPRLLTVPGSRQRHPSGKRNSLPAGQLMQHREGDAVAGSLPPQQLVSPSGHHYHHGITRLFHRTKRSSESADMSPLEGPFNTQAGRRTRTRNANSQSAADDGSHYSTPAAGVSRHPWGDDGHHAAPHYHTRSATQKSNPKQPENNNDDTSTLFEMDDEMC